MAERKKFNNNNVIKFYSCMFNFTLISFIFSIVINSSRNRLIIFKDRPKLYNLFIKELLSSIPDIKLQPNRVFLLLRSSDTCNFIKVNFFQNVRPPHNNYFT